MIFSRDGDKIQVNEPQIETFGASFDRILEMCSASDLQILGLLRNELSTLLKSNNLEEVEIGFHELGPSTGKALVADHLRSLKN